MPFLKMRLSKFVAVSSLVPSYCDQLYRCYPCDV